MDEGGKKEDPVFRSEDIEKTKANSNQEYFVNVINDPFQQWLLRKKPSKVKTEQKFETPVATPQTPEEKPKKPQCRTTIRLTTERLKRDSAKYKTTIIILAAAASLAFVSSIALAVLLIMNSSSTTAKAEPKVKTEYIEVEKPSKEQEEDLCAYYLQRTETDDFDGEYAEKYQELCSDMNDQNNPERGGGENVE